jgi:kumamolisin
MQATLVLRQTAVGAELLARQEAIDFKRPLSRPKLTDDELAHLHDAEATDITAVESFASSHGLTVIPSWAGTSGREVVLSGTAGTFSAAFKTTLGTVTTPHGHHIAPTTPVHVPVELADAVVAIHGLDSTPHAAPLVRPVPSALGIDPREIARDQYRAPLDQLSGRGERIAVIAFGGGYWQEDLDTYFCEVLGLPTPPVVTAVSVAKHPGGRGPSNRPTPMRALGRLVDDLNAAESMAAFDAEVDCPTCSARFLATLETTMDIQIAGAIAPGAAIDVYFASNDLMGYVAAIETAIGLRPGGAGKASVISISWGKGEAWFSGNGKNAIGIALEKARDHGVTVVAASGDLGAVGVEPGSGYETRANVSFPASCQWVLGCGGTSIRDDGEVVWNAAWKGMPMATGGGISGFVERPSWQDGHSLPQDALHRGQAWLADGVADGFRGRGVPDVAANADPATGYLLHVGGRPTTGGGTSASAPVWAALLALVNEAIGTAATTAGRTEPLRLGYANRLLYRPEFSEAFGSVTRGDNRLAGHGESVVAFSAAPGWNPCTGLGTPRLDRLIALVTVPEPTP